MKIVAENLQNIHKYLQNCRQSLHFRHASLGDSPQERTWCCISKWSAENDVSVSGFVKNVKGVHVIENSKEAQVGSTQYCSLIGQFQTLAGVSDVLRYDWSICTLRLSWAVILAPSIVRGRLKLWRHHNKVIPGSILVEKWACDRKCQILQWCKMISTLRIMYGMKQ